MTRQCNLCDETADIDIFTLDPHRNLINIQCMCATHALKKRRAKTNKGYFLRSSVEAAQITKELTRVR